MHMSFQTPRPVPSRHTDSGISGVALGRVRLGALGERCPLGRPPPLGNLDIAGERQDLPARAIALPP
jgi:hypothetical protein